MGVVTLGRHNNLKRKRKKSEKDRERKEGKILELAMISYCHNDVLNVVVVVVLFCVFCLSLFAGQPFANNLSRPARPNILHLPTPLFCLTIHDEI